MKINVDTLGQKVSRGVLIAGMAVAMVAGTVSMAGQNAGAQGLVESTSGAGATITMTVNALSINILQVNGQSFGNNDEANSTAIKTQSAVSEVHFKTDGDAYVKIVLGDKVLWEGNTKAGQPVTAYIDLGQTAPGVYNLAIRAAQSRDEADHYSVAFFHLNYQATIPSIIPDNNNENIYNNGGVKAPNTGWYVTAGGRLYSMTTVATVVLLIAVVIFLAASKARKQAAEPAKATTKKTKAPRKKMDLI